MRWVAIFAVVACRTARPVEVPQTPSASAAGAQGIVIDANLLENIPAPWQANWVLDGGQAWTDSGVFGPAGLPTQSIVGRYYVDGIYVESRGPHFPIWR